MPKLGRFPFLVFLAVACAPYFTNAQVKPLQMDIYDYSGMSEGALRQFAASTQRILSSEKLSVQVFICPTAKSASCGRRDPMSSRLEIRLLAYAPSTTHSKQPILGQALVSGSSGKYATVFVRAVQQQASASGVPWLVVLAYATAHEVGHLLLGRDVHTSRGLMKAHWNRNDYQSMNQRGCHFTAEQLRQLASFNAAAPVPELARAAH